MNDLTVLKIMSSPVECLRPDMKLSEARRILTESNFHHLPVVEESSKVVGIISSTDLLQISCEAYGVEGEQMDSVLDRQFKLTEVMKEPVVVNQNDTIRHAAEILAAGKIHSLPVVDDDGKLHGIITSTDLIGFLVGQLAA